MKLFTRIKAAIVSNVPWFSPPIVTISNSTLQAFLAIQVRFTITLIYSAFVVWWAAIGFTSTLPFKYRTIIKIQTIDKYKMKLNSFVIVFLRFIWMTKILKLLPSPYSQRTPEKPSRHSQLKLFRVSSTLTYLFISFIRVIFTLLYVVSEHFPPFLHGSGSHPPLRRGNKSRYQ